MQRRNLTVHVKTNHLYQKEHECETCGKCFGQKGHFTLHAKTIHLQEREHKCEICGMVFGQKGHVKTGHLNH